MKLLKPSRLTSLLIVCLIGVSLLTACGARQALPTTAPQSAAPQATATRSATAAPQPTTVPQATAVPSVAPATQVATLIPPSATPTHTPAPATTAQPDTSGAALDQLLQKLEQANSAGDSLSDVPELK